ncbi:MAG: metal-dependent transcriptional regulator [Methanomassiliicoccales archaeon]
MVSKNAEDYLETIYDLTRDGAPAKTKDIAARLEVSPASVSEMVRKLAEQGYLDYERYRGVYLNDRGLKEARRVRRRHRLLHRFLVDILGIRGEKGEEEACRLEHIVSDDSMKRICKIVRPGNGDSKPFPECNDDCDLYDDESILPLSEMEEGEEAMISFLTCDNPGKVRRLISMGFVPGRKVKLEEDISMGGSLLVTIEDCRVALAEDYAGLVHVKR